MAMTIMIMMKRRGIMVSFEEALIHWEKESQARFHLQIIG